MALYANHAPYQLRQLVDIQTLMVFIFVRSEFNSVVAVPAGAFQCPNVRSGEKGLSGATCIDC